MHIRDWMTRAMGTDSWARMEHTLPGALSTVIDMILYNLSDEGKQEYRGLVLKLSHAERMYVGFKSKDWPKWEGRDGDYVDVRKSLKQIQYLLEAYAFNEGVDHGKPHYCSACQSAAP